VANFPYVNGTAVPYAYINRRNNESRRRTLQCGPARFIIPSIYGYKRIRNRFRKNRGTRVRGSRRISMPNVVKIGREDIKIFRFFMIVSVCHLGFVWGTFGPPTVSGGVYRSAKFGYDRCSSFYNMNISIFGAFGRKMSIHAPKIVFFWAI